MYMMENGRLGMQEGRGVYKYASGDVYDGEWKAE